MFVNKKNPFRFEAEGRFFSLMKMSFLSLIFCRLYVRTRQKKNDRGLSLKKTFCARQIKSFLTHQFDFVNYQYNQTFFSPCFV